MSTQKKDYSMNDSLQMQMQITLKGMDQARNKGQGFNVRRSEIEEIGNHPAAAVKCFEDLQGMLWGGEYIVPDETSWIGAWVDWVS